MASHVSAVASKSRLSADVPKYMLVNECMLWAKNWEAILTNRCLGGWKRKKKRFFFWLFFSKGLHKRFRNATLLKRTIASTWKCFKWCFAQENRPSIKDSTPPNSNASHFSFLRWSLRPWGRRDASGWRIVGNKNGGRWLSAPTGLLWEEKIWHRIRAGKKGRRALLHSGAKQKKQKLGSQCAIVLARCVKWCTRLCSMAEKHADRRLKWSGGFGL